MKSFLSWPGCVLLLVFAAVFAHGAAVTTTTVTDTIYHADGTLAGGLVLVSWPAFTTAGGQAVPGGSTSATIGTGGLLTLQLAPNVGATPTGTYYTAVYHLDDGTVSRESWSIPVSATAVTLSAIRATVLPASVAVQTASKSYVDSVVAAALAGQPVTGDVTFLNRTGDSMVGPLALAGDPTTSAQAANKHYVDTAVTAVSAGLTAKVGTAPAATQTVAQPAGTQMQVNRLNGSSFASQYVSDRGNNGIANVMTGPDCVSGCDVVAEPSYGSTEASSALSWNFGPSSGTHLEDLRGGGRHDLYLNPVNLSDIGFNAGQIMDVTSTRSAASVRQMGTAQPASAVLGIYHEGVAGGSNQFPFTIEGSKVPYFKSNYVALSVNGTYNTMGQHGLLPETIKCYGVGDCLIGAEFLTASGGFRDEADEGAHPMDLQIQEDTAVFTGSCAGGCTQGSTTVAVNVTSGAGTQGEGRFLIDKNPAKTISAGVLTGGTGNRNGPTFESALFSGSSFPASVYLQTAQAALSQAQILAPGAVTLPIATSGLPSMYGTSTSALPQSSGVACVVDAPAGLNPTNYEMATYSVVDTTHLLMTLNKVHQTGATIAVGGLCGYGLEQTVDTANGIRQIFPVIGTASATSLYYAGHMTSIVGKTGTTSAYANVASSIAAISRAGGVATVTLTNALPADVNGLTLTMSGIADASYDGSFAVTTTGANSFTYANAGANGSSSGGTAGIVTGGFVLYPIAEVLGVSNTQSKAIDGTLTLAPNTVAWAAGDAVEQPHYFQEAVEPDTMYVTQTVPRPTDGYQRSGTQYQGNVGPGLRGFTITNAVPAASYFGNGGTHTAPDVAYEAQGVWTRTFEVAAGEKGVFDVHCNSHGCGKWNSGYDLFELDSAGGLDTAAYQPVTSSLTWTMRGTPFTFAPGGFTANTVTAGTLHGSLSASDVASGTLNAARLPLFGASGMNHSLGAVPDPGATAGTSRFLREDGSWATPPSSGGGSGSGGASGTAAITGGTIQNAAISGGSIDSTAVGQNAPAPGKFSALAVTGCNWFLAGANQGIGTCAPQAWNGVTGVDGSNLQINSAGSARVILTSNGQNGSMAEFHFVNMGAPSGSRNWRFNNNTSGQLTVDMNSDNYTTHTVAMQCQPNGACTFPNGVTASNFAGILSGRTGVLGGSALPAGSCVTGGVAVAGATPGTPVAVSASDGSLPNALTMLSAAVTSPGSVTVQVCAAAAVTPAAVAYNVRVLQ